MTNSNLHRQDRLHLSAHSLQPSRLGSYCLMSLMSLAATGCAPSLLKSPNLRLGPQRVFSAWVLTFLPMRRLPSSSGLSAATQAGWVRHTMRMLM